MQMADVLEQRRAERLDLLPADVHLVRPDPELEEAVGEVPDEEDRRVADEPYGGDPHQPGAPSQGRISVPRPHLFGLDRRHTTTSDRPGRPPTPAHCRVRAMQ